MTCAETQRNLTAYLDGRLTEGARATTGAHLASCPVCRQHLAETRAVVRALNQLERPQPPADLLPTISGALMIERAARRQQPPQTPWAWLANWVRPRVMPYTVGAFVSLLLFLAVSSALRPHVGMLREMARENSMEEIQMVVVGVPGQPNDLRGLVPSLNPNGALAKLVRSPAEGAADDDDMVLAADVFSNGDAALAEIVQPPRNRHMLYEVEAAFRQAPAFLPAARDRRPGTVRVVLSLSKVNVQERSF
ncbi:MAG TPA: zf-HC2 domain-containing protein [Pyrinomonadaceae bacterium]|jgi:hypothetical protein